MAFEEDKRMRFGIVALAALLLAGCNSQTVNPAAPISERDQRLLAQAPQIEMDYWRMNLRVPYRTSEPPGTIVVETSSRHLYLVEQGGTAIRYQVAVGNEAFGWTGTATIQRKAEWPSWTPPAEMRRRWPHVPAFMEGGPRNPLGARALYLYQNGRDTLYRIHGTNSPMEIGEAVSSGCIRMHNEQAIDLFNRVPNGTRVVVR
jgi:lipoprotein-anchoring transpeptidase ErfK/SrfK